MLSSGYIDELREKPHHVRHGIAIGGSLLVTAIVATFWFAGLGDRFSKNDTVVYETNQSPGVLEGTFQELGTEFERFTAGVRQGVDGATVIFGSEEE